MMEYWVNQNTTPTLSLPLKGREIVMLLPLQGGGQEGDGVVFHPPFQYSNIPLFQFFLRR
jgi:hypothetical protein